jgi:hypothetical protein
MLMQKIRKPLLKPQLQIKQATQLKLQLQL